MGSGKLTLLAGIADSGDGANDRTMLSGGYKFDFGLSLAASVNSRTQAEGPDLESTLLSVNYQINKVNIGVDVGSSGEDGENELQQIGAEWKITSSADLYGGLTNFDNADGTSVSALFTGLRYKYWVQARGTWQFPRLAGAAQLPPPQPSLVQALVHSPTVFAFRRKM